MRITPAPTPRANLTTSGRPSPTARWLENRPKKHVADYLVRYNPRRDVQDHATVNDLLNRHLTMLHAGEHTRQSYLLMAAEHLRPTVGHPPLRGSFVGCSTVCCPLRSIIASVR